MTSRIIALFTIAAVMVGCQSGADTSTNAAPAPDKTAATADNTPKAADNGATTGTPPVTDSGGGMSQFVGKWTVDDPTMKGVVTEFKDDGSVVMIGPAPAGMGKGTMMEADATMKLDGDKATLHMTGGKVTPGPDADAKTKQAIDMANKQLSDPKAIAAQKDMVGTVKWNGKDSFSVTDDKDKKTKTFTRAS